MENLTVFKIITDNEFIPTVDYDIANERKHQKIKCIKETDNGWYFSTEMSKEDLSVLFEQPYARMKSETGAFRIHDLDKTFLTYTGTRDSI